MTTSVYLSGPPSAVNDSSLAFSADWKAYAASTFLKSGITVANPIELDLTGFVTNVSDQANFSSVKHSLSLIDRADSLLANLTQINESVTMEMFYAHRQGKQVVVVGNEPFSPWVMFHSEARFQKLREALDYLVYQPSSFDTITWSTQFESQLKRRSEQYPPEGELDFEYYGGLLPILVLAPHAAAYFKDGNLYRSESYTGALAVLLNKLTGCHSLITSYCVAADPVYYLSSPYVKFLCHLIKKVDIKLVLVLHGTEDWNNPHDLILTSWNKNSLIDKAEYFNLLISLLKVKDFKEIGFDSGDILSNSNKTVSHLLFEDLSIPTMKIDVHKRYRLPKLQPALYMNLHTVLAQFLMLLGSKS
ncbi:MAG: hypothetical protein HY094_02415 [Candidatus Melainabacteria bacterium]|nr:hypothetical protein [Candidatus Melainabacteria bacterium]